MKKKTNCHPRIPYPTKRTFKTEDEIKTFSHMAKAERIHHQQTCTVRSGKGSL